MSGRNPPLYCARRKKVDEKSCVTPAGTSNELDVQNEWEENAHTLTLIAMQGHQQNIDKRHDAFG